MQGAVLQWCVCLCASPLAYDSVLASCASSCGLLCAAVIEMLPHVLQCAAASKEFARTLPRRVQSATQGAAALLQEILALLRDKAVQAGSWMAFAVKHPTAAAGELLVNQLCTRGPSASLATTCRLVSCCAARQRDQSWGLLASIVGIVRIQGVP